MEDESLSEQQLTELAKTHQTLEYLSKLNKTLLLLSKIDNSSIQAFPLLLIMPHKLPMRLQNISSAD